MQDQKLMDYFKFDETDLEANRKGEYSEAQRKRLFKGLFAPKKYYFYKVQAPISIIGEKWDYHAAAEIHYVLYAAKKGFIVKKDLLDIMTKGDVYTIYYCNYVESKAEGWDSADKVLSLEFVSKAPIASQASIKPGSNQERLQELKNMLDTNLISKQEFEQKKKEILDQV
jgi:hypothetical protein